MGLPEIDCTKCASEMVCVAIGTNLLLPVAPSIMGRFLNGIEVDPEAIIKKKFSDVKKHIDDSDLRKIGKIAASIDSRKDQCSKAPGLRWRLLDIGFAALGVFLLWSGWAKDNDFAAWLPLLFLPAAFAAGYPFACFLLALGHMKLAINWARWKAKRRKAKAAKAKNASDDVKISTFIAKARAAIEENP